MVKPLSRWFLGLLVGLFMVQTAQAQKTFPQNGVYDERDGLFAFTNATIQKSWNEKLEKATLLIRGGRIEAVGVGIPVPTDAVVIDCQGKFITPSFIEPFANYGMPEPKAEGAPIRQGQPLSNKKGAFSWNEALKTEFRAHENFVINSKEAESWRAVGFGALLSHRMDGLSRGSAVAVSTADDREHNLIIQSIAGHVMSFNKGTSTQSYPSSLMGGIALMRQTYLDGLWYASQATKEETNYSLEAWNALQNVPQIFAVSDKLEALRAIKIANEFGKKYIIKGNGDEYQRLSELKATGAAFILPLSFPQAMDVEDPFDALQVSITDLKHWELAPTNPARLAKEGIDFCFTTYGLRDRKELWAQLQKAMENGLSEAEALKALTATPAKLLNLNDLGSLDKGKWANFLITDKPVLSKDVKVFHNWVQGKGYVLADMNKPVIKGTFSFELGADSYKMLQITTSDAQLFKNDTAKTRVTLTQDLSKVTLTFTPVGEKEVVRLSGVYEGGVMKGRGQLADGTWVNWSATPMAFAGEAEKANATASKTDVSPKGEVIYPFSAFGRKELPKAETVLFKNATVWTGEKEGILKETDVLVENGKIAKIGKNLSVLGAKTVDATGKHLTAGIIDEHSHVAMSKGTNEGTQASSAEVRVGDIINCDDVNIYRQLAGGVTASHILHGSANPIGGQTQLIKFRWGYSPEKMKFEKWDQFIKFALGENVKQSSRAPDNFATARFPQTRMGVEQVYDDYFTRAAEYAQLRKSGKPYRKDLDLECVADILEQKCFITCHSYVQSEINMLMKVADRHKFKVNTFTHILEGYKVADKMKQHGVGAAGFADWWDYKYEVYEAIPQSPSMMNNEGVLTAINSDDAEMARRLNQEAAKTLMYGSGLKDETTIWNFVTLNPAKMLHVDNRVGSIKVGKDADVVLWNTTPLSIYAKAEQTYVDGIKFFDREEDVQLRADMQKERARLIQKMLQIKKAGGPTQPVQARTQRAYECEDDEDEMRD